jgi:tRNA nucleotidyltransferase (CCA-adding enzyme)
MIVNPADAVAGPRDGDIVDLAPPRAVREIAERLRRAGFQAWAVGGAVRDRLLGLGGGDWDIATSAPPHDVRHVFRRTVPLGIEHGTVGVLASDGVLYEVTTFRHDVETDGRHAVVAFATTLEEDLARRDFTFNAIAWDPVSGELRDPYDGLRDLRQARLRTVGDPAARFAEDYLRVLRALRFAGHFVLTVDPAAWQAIVAAVPQLDRLSAERVREELFKILGRTRPASAALQLYAESGVLARIFPELAATVGLDSGGQLDAWRESLAAVDALPPTRPLLRLAALLANVGMPAARSRDLRGGWRFTGHETIGARRAEEIMQRLKASNADTAHVVALVRHQSDLFPPDAPDAGVRRWLRDISTERVRDLFRLRIARWRARREEGGLRDLVARWRHAHRILLERPVLAVHGLAIDGTDLKRLGLEPGPRFGEILRELLERVIDEPALNERERLIAIVEAEHRA